MASTFEFDSAFEGLTGHPPFPWQRRLFVEWLSRGQIPPAIEIPTGLGKTAVMAVWLLARAECADLPRRLVHVVERRSVADHATELAEVLRDRLQQLDELEPVRRSLGLEGRALPVSTPRGKFVDDRDWMVDPSTPAIIVGGIETVGSRLLFEGHGLHRCLRPYAAGLLGCDTLVVLDEAHASRAFESLLRTIERGQRASSVTEPGTVGGGFAGPMVRGVLPPRLRVLPLFASPRSEAPAALSLDADDRENEIVRRRLDAEKFLRVEDLDDCSTLDAALAERALTIMRQELSACRGSVRIAIFCDRRGDAARVALRLRKSSKKQLPEAPGAAVVVIAGDRRVREHGGAGSRLKQYGLLADSDAAPETPVFLVATEPAEVGADLDADHMVCDLVAWDRMVRRLGRVNRRGCGRARVLVIDQGSGDGRSPGTGAPDRAAVRALLAALPTNETGAARASPAVLAGLGEDGAIRRQIIAASTHAPLYPALTRPLVEAWAMTSLTENPGRPEVGPWLRGWLDRPERSTTVVWRRHLPVQLGDDPAVVRNQTPHAEAAFFEAAPPQMEEGLETAVGLAADWLRKRARRMLERLKSGAELMEGTGRRARDNRHGNVESTRRIPELDAPVAFILDGANRPSCSLSLTAIPDRSTHELERMLVGRFLVVDARLSGLEDGLLNDRSEGPVSTIEDGWGGEAREASSMGSPPFRVRETTDADRRARIEFPAQDLWLETHAMPCRFSPRGEVETWVVVEKRPAGGESEEARAIAAVAQPLANHQAWVADEALRIARLLGLEEADRAMLVAAALRHDEGKRAPRWQRAFGAGGRDGPLGKTPGPVNRHILNGYRHELKSVLDAEDAGLGDIARSDPRFDLALHLIAAHHGNARPTIDVDGYDDAPPSTTGARAQEIAARFARLQRQWGPWGLAWWEALLRAADHSASRKHEAEAVTRRPASDQAQGAQVRSVEARSRGAS